MSELLDRLRAVVGGGGLLTGEDVRSRAAGIWKSEGIRARAIVRPRTTQEVSRVLALCHEAPQSVVTHGGLTGLVDGAISTDEDVVLSLERMTAIEEVDTLGKTLTVQAGVTLQRAQEAAGDAGLMLALDLGARGSCTIGGNVATNAGGVRVIRYGMTREQVLGLEAVLADGRVVSSMNHMLKNNAGYDLKQLFIGSEGTLGVVTRVVLRLRERPAATNTALLGAGSLDAVCGLLRHLDAGLGGTLSAFEVMWRDFYRLTTTPPATNTPPLGQDHEFYVIAESLAADAEGSQRRFEKVLGHAIESGLAEDAVVAASGRERDAIWAVREDVEQKFQYGPAFIFDVSLGIADMERYVSEVRRRLEDEWDDHHCWVFGHLGDGNLHIVASVGSGDAAARAKVEAAVYAPLERIGGSVSAEHGIGLEKKPWLHVSRSAEEIELMRLLKRTLDPRGILNPGKVVD